MKHLGILVMLVITFVSTNTFAQDFQGEATYKTHRKFDIKLDSSQMNSDMHQRMMDMMKKQFEKTFILSFNKSESLYKEDKQLESPQPTGMVMVMVDAGGSDILYKNMKENRFASQNDVYGKIFLVKDELQKHDWQLSAETKNIGDYTCYKATMTREVERMERGISVNGDKELSDEVHMEEITITAWYTPDIPVNNGPRNYHGLPGLILEINDGNQTIMCSKIVLNPDDKVSISEPTKGKKVDQKAYDEIMAKKAKEMRERYDSERGDGDGIEIKIRG
jgi:GLPGLI family protein